MDLDSLMSQQLTQSVQQKSAIKDLLPQQQKQRSYSQNQKVPQKLNLYAEKYLIDEYKGEWLMWYTLSWPGMPLPTNERNATPKQLRDFAQEFIEARSYPGEEKYYKLKSIDKKTMKIVFDVDKWIKESFGSTSQRFSPPLSLKFKTHKRLPGLVYSSSSLINLNKFMSEKFKEYMKTKSSKLRHKEFSFLKKTSHDLFNYSFSFRDTEFTATLKYSVILASLAAYMIWKHKKELSKSDIKSLQRKASNMKDIKRLDKYIKRL